jgi:hypothetical protein
MHTIYLMHVYKHTCTYVYTFLHTHLHYCTYTFSHIHILTQSPSRTYAFSRTDQKDRDVKLDIHVDDSDVTFNVALRSEGTAYTGGALTMYVG